MGMPLNAPMDNTLMKPVVSTSMSTLATLQQRRPTSKSLKSTTSTQPKSRGVKVIKYSKVIPNSKTRILLFVSAPCPSHFWGKWGSWSECSKSCGNGTAVRVRDCFTSVTDRLVDPGNCYGEEEETAKCYERDCPGN